MRSLDWIDRGCRVIVATGMAAMIVAISIQVVLRYVFNSQLSGTSEVARFAFVWLTFMGSVSAFRQRSHLSIDLVTGLMGPRGAKLLDTLLCVLTLIACYFLLVYGFELAQRTWTQFSPTLRVRMGLIYAAIPISALLIGLFAAVDGVKQTMELLRGKAGGPPGGAGPNAAEHPTDGVPE